MSHRPANVSYFQYLHQGASRPFHMPKQEPLPLGNTIIDDMKRLLPHQQATIRLFLVSQLERNKNFMTPCNIHFSRSDKLKKNALLNRSCEQQKRILTQELAAYTKITDYLVQLETIQDIDVMQIIVDEINAA